MRPLRLTMTAFGPYAGTESVDFESLTELGLFVVAGNNGAGKTTIFDALHYCLYGTLPGRRANYARLRSDHAAPDIECKATLEFLAQGHRWRVERSPKQPRPKRRGNGTTVAESRATLYRFEGGQAVAVTTRIGEVSERCRELVGLSGRQFERVALLPQGEFSRVLRESGTERRELLRTLFSSEVFDEATALLVTQAADAARDDQAEAEALDARVNAVATQFAQLSGAPVGMSLDELTRALDDFRDGALQQLQNESRRDREAAQALARSHQQALDIMHRVARRDQVLQQLAEHRAGADQHGHDLRRIDRARAAVPVAELARSVDDQQIRVAQATRAIEHLWAQAATGLQNLGRELAVSADDPSVAEALVQTQQLLDDLGRLDAAERSVGDLRGELAQLQAAERRLGDRSSRFGEQQRVARSERRQLDDERTALLALPDVDECRRAQRVLAQQAADRQALRDLDQAAQLGAEQLVALDRRCDSAARALDEARAADATQPRVEAALAEATRALAEAERRVQALDTYRRHFERLAPARAAHRTAQTFAEHQWDCFVAGTAGRLAAELVDDQACPVCGSQDHPAPAAIAADEAAPVSAADVADARADAARRLADCHEIQTAIEALTAVDSDLGVVDPGELADAVAETKARALDAAREAEAVAAAAARLETCQAEVAHAEADREQERQARHHDERRRHELLGALAAAAHDSLDETLARLARAESELMQAEVATTRLLELERRLSELEGSLHDIDLEILSARTDQASVQAQIALRADEVDQAMTHRAEIIAELGFEMAEPGRVGAWRTHAEQSLALLHEVQSQLVARRGALEAHRKAAIILDERLGQSPFATVPEARDAFEEPQIIEQLEQSASAYEARGERLGGQLGELQDLPDEMPDAVALGVEADAASMRDQASSERLTTVKAALERFAAELASVENDRAKRNDHDHERRRLERVAALVNGDNDRNTSLENWVLGAHLRHVVELANIRLAQSSQQRFQLCVLDDGENRRGRWGLDLGVEDAVTGTQRPTAGLSGGELFQASLALALGLADAVMNQSAGVHIDALFIDEGFGSLDEASVDRAIDLLDELRDRGALVGVITHVPALLAALPIGLSVEANADGSGSTINQRRRAA